MASFIGLVVHAFYAVTFGPLYYRDLERNKISALNFNNGDFDSETNISLESENEITWWIVNLKSVNGKLIRPNYIDCWIETDASLEGWGSKFNENLTGGRWNDEERSHHINYLELLSIFCSLKIFFQSTKVTAYWCAF